MDGESYIRPDSPDFYYTDAIGDHAVARIESALAANAPSPFPFFGYVAFTAPHWPLHAPEEEIARYASLYRCGWDAIRTARHESQRDSGLVDRRSTISPRDPESWPFDESRYPDWEALRMAVYAAQIDRMDQAIGRVVSTLQNHDALANTLIFFLSDNGGCAEFLQEDTLAPAPHRYNIPTVDGRPMRVGNLRGGRRRQVPGQLRRACDTAHGGRELGAVVQERRVAARPTDLVRARGQPRGARRALEARQPASGSVGAVQH